MGCVGEGRQSWPAEHGEKRNLYIALFTVFLYRKRNKGAHYVGDSTDRIQKRILLRTPIERVWKAISNADEFGSWFGVRLDGPFAPGARATGRIVPTSADPVVAAQQKPYEGTPWAVDVVAMEPMRLFAFRWHPFAIDPGVDYSQEPTTLITFELERAPEGTWLTITESGFDSIPLARRAQAFEANDRGWAAQTKLLTKFLGAQTEA